MNDDKNNPSPSNKFIASNPEENNNFLEALNPNSLKVINCAKLEPLLSDPKNEIFQVMHNQKNMGVGYSSMIGFKKALRLNDGSYFILGLIIFVVRFTLQYSPKSSLP